MTVSSIVNRKSLVIDAKGLIVGRLSSLVSKLLLQGNSIAVINADGALFSGTKSNIMDKIFTRMEIKSAIHPRHTPSHYKTPEGILKKIIHGMLPRYKPRGMEAFKRLRIYGGTPEKLMTQNISTLDSAKPTRSLAMYTSLAEIALLLGRKQL